MAYPTQEERRAKYEARKESQRKKRETGSAAIKERVTKRHAQVREGISSTKKTQQYLREKKVTRASLLPKRMTESEKKSKSKEMMTKVHAKRNEAKSKKITCEPGYKNVKGKCVLSTVKKASASTSPGASTSPKKKRSFLEKINPFDKESRERRKTKKWSW